MKVISIGTDRRVFVPGSTTRGRVLEYGGIFEELHLIVYAKRSFGFSSEQVSGSVWVHPTNSWIKIAYPLDAWRIARSLPGEFDVVTAQDPFECGLAGLLIRWWLGLRLQLQVHTDFLSPQFASSCLNWARVLIGKWVLPRADRVRVVSDRIARSITESGLKLKNEPVVLPIWVDVSACRAASAIFDLHQKYPRFKKTILMVSRLEPEKGVFEALSSLRELLARSREIGIVIVGSGKEENRLKKLTRDLGIEDFVVFEGWQDDLISFYKTADLFLNTSFYEGYGLSMVEAAACGLSVISTDVGVAREIGATIVSRFEDLGELVQRSLYSPKPVLDISRWPTRKEYLDLYKQAME